MTALLIFVLNVSFVCWMVHRLVQLALLTWAESDEVVVPIILGEPARDHYEAGELVAYLVSMSRQNVPGPRGMQ